MGNNSVPFVKQKSKERKVSSKKHHPLPKVLQK